MYFRIPLVAAESLPAQQAATAWEHRDQPGKTEEAIHLWQEALKTAPEHDLWTALAKAEGRAVRHSKELGARQKWAEEAKSSAEKAIEKSPQSAEAYAAYGEALGQWANTHKGVHSLGAVKQAVEALQKSIALNPKYAYAHMLLAEFYRQSPRVISVGDKQKALEQARLAVEDAPQYAINHLVLAQAYLDLGKKPEGVAELQKIVVLAAPANAVPETRADQNTARTLLKSLGVATTPPADAQTSQQPPQCGEAAGSCSEAP